MHMLDTNICIYIIKKKPISVFQKFESLSVGSVAMSLVTYGELELVALRSSNAKKALAILDELAAYIPVLPMPTDTAKEYADIRANLSAKGMPIGNNDLWIAAHTRALGHTLVTNNLKEFGRVENLKLDNWVLE
jgi:tRNA(fMet)-specific endonuclease VapC